ncbi:ribonuclease HI [Deinococcus lacus]|uniref:Ribonuclease HI n=1 Tax=Deinococcus lacus TaxID=392561 RepID=A0ABW1YCP4_9DEIO
MNQAYVDASWREWPAVTQSSPADLSEWGLGGWGLVLIRLGHWPQQFQGQLQAPDNNVAELNAALEAVRHAPAGERLQIFSDNQAVLLALQGRASRLAAEVQQVWALAEERSISVQICRAERTQRPMRLAHELANSARLGQTLGALCQAELLIEQRAGSGAARLSLRRPGQTLGWQVELDPLNPLPPSAQALLAGLNLVPQAGPLPPGPLLVRRASALAQALWLRPKRALPGAREALLETRHRLDACGIELEFE